MADRATASTSSADGNAVGVALDAGGADLADKYPLLLGVDPDREAGLYAALAGVLRRGLPEGWALEADDTNGCIYFWNALSGESLWMHPDHELFEKGVNWFRAALKDRNPASFLRNKWQSLDSREVEDGEWAGPYQDDDGQKYWHNVKSDDSVWYDPQVEVARRRLARSGLLLSLLALCPTAEEPCQKSSKPSSVVDRSAGVHDRHNGSSIEPIRAAVDEACHESGKPKVSGSATPPLGRTTSTGFSRETPRQTPWQTADLTDPLAGSVDDSQDFSELPSPPHGNADDPILTSVDEKEASFQLVPGAKVTVQGLKKRPDLNGEQAVCTTWHPDKCRWEIKLRSGEFLCIKPENLKPVLIASSSRSSLSGRRGESFGNKCTPGMPRPLDRPVALIPSVEEEPTEKYPTLDREDFALLRQKCAEAELETTRQSTEDRSEVAEHRGVERIDSGSAPPPPPGIEGAPSDDEPMCPASPTGATEESAETSNANIADAIAKKAEAEISNQIKRDAKRLGAACKIQRAWRKHQKRQERRAAGGEFRRQVKADRLLEQRTKAATDIQRVARGLLARKQHRWMAKRAQEKKKAGEERIDAGFKLEQRASKERALKPTLNDALWNLMDDQQPSGQSSNAIGGRGKRQFPTSPSKGRPMMFNSQAPKGKRNVLADLESRAYNKRNGSPGPESGGAAAGQQPYGLLPPRVPGDQGAPLSGRDRVASCPDSVVQRQPLSSKDLLKQTALQPGPSKKLEPRKRRAGTEPSTMQLLQDNDCLAPSSGPGSSVGSRAGSRGGSAGLHGTPPLSLPHDPFDAPFAAGPRKFGSGSSAPDFKDEASAPRSRVNSKPPTGFDVYAAGGSPEMTRPGSSAGSGKPKFSPRLPIGSSGSAGQLERPDSSSSVVGPSVKRVVRGRLSTTGASFQPMGSASFQPLQSSTLRMEAATEIEAQPFMSGQGGGQGPRGSPVLRRPSGPQAPTVSCGIERIPGLLGKEHVQKNIAGGKYENF